MEDEMDQAKKLAEIQIGADLSTLSVADLDVWIDAYKAEIERLEAEKARKKDSIDLAQSFFKS